MKRKVIAYKNLPAKLPLTQTLLVLLILDKYNAPQWVWGVVITIYSLLWILSIVSIANEKLYDLFDDNQLPATLMKKTLTERMNEVKGK